MKRTLFATAAIFAALASAMFAFGDIARPKPTPKASLYSGLTITTDPKASEARLMISENTLKELLHDAARNGDNTSLSQRITHSSNRTILAGVFMFLAISLAGIWFVRSSPKRHTKVIAAVLLAVVAFGIGTMLVRANAGPPGYIRWQNLPQSLKDGKETTGGVEIAVVPGDDNLKLILPMRKSGGSGEE
jgi:hypothetical protein